MVQEFITLPCASVEIQVFLPNGVVHLLREHSSVGADNRVCLEEERPSQTAWGENTSDAHNCNSTGKHHVVITRKRLKMSGWKELCGLPRSRDDEDWGCTQRSECSSTWAGYPRR